MLTVERIIPPDWIDYNGHLTEARYLELFSLATDGFLAAVGCDQAYVAKGKSYFTLETHLVHLAETYKDDTVQVVTNCLMNTGKKLHLFHILKRDDDTNLATGEHLLLHVDLKIRKTCDPDRLISDKLNKLARSHSSAKFLGDFQPRLSFNRTAN